MRNLNLLFSKTNFGPTWVYVLSSISTTLHNFSTGFLSICTGILELESVSKSFETLQCFSKFFLSPQEKSLTALFVKTKIYFCCFNIENKHISKNPLNHFFSIDCSQKVKSKIFQKMFAVLKMELQINEHLLKMPLYKMINC